MKGHKLFTQLIIVALCMLLPLIACGMFFLQYSLRIHQENISRNAELAVEMLAENVTGILENTQSILTNYTLDSSSPVMLYSSSGAI